MRLSLVQAACLAALSMTPVCVAGQGAPEIPTSGRVQALVAFVRFRDDGNVPQGCRTRAAREWSDPGTLPAVAHHILSPAPEPPFADSSLTAYFYEQSRERFVLYGRTYPHLIVTERDEQAYGVGSARLLDRGLLTGEILERMDADPAFDLADFDADGDGRVDYLFVVLRRMDGLQLVQGGAPALASLGAVPAATDGGPAVGAGRGSYVIYGSAGIIIPQLDLLRLLAHEFGHDLWRASPLYGGHIPYLGGDHGVPANGSRRLGYALMVGRLSTRPQRDVVDTRGDMTVSAFERDLVDDGWIECPVLAEAGPVTLGDLYTRSDCRRIVVRNGGSTRTLYLSNRQRVGYFDRLQFNPCQSSYHGLMTTGLLVHTSEGRRLGVPAADGTLVLSIDSSAYAGDLYGPESKTQLTPWTRPNISGYTTYPAGFRMEPDNWQALDGIRRADDEAMAFTYVPDARLRPVIREDSWMGAETTGTVFRDSLVVTNGARLTIESGTAIRMAGGTRLVVDEGASLRVEPGARIELEPGSGLDGRGEVVAPVGAPERGGYPFVGVAAPGGP